MRVLTVEDLAALPEGTEFVSEPDCVWYSRYEGVRWQKKDSLTVWCMDKTDNLGFDQTKSVSHLPHFVDPLPARVVAYGEVPRAKTEELFQNKA